MIKPEYDKDQKSHFMINVAFWLFCMGCKAEKSEISWIAKALERRREVELKTIDINDPIYCLTCNRLVSEGLSKELESRVVNCTCGHEYFLVKN